MFRYFLAITMTLLLSSCQKSHESTKKSAPGPKPDSKQKSSSSNKVAIATFDELLSELKEHFRSSPAELSITIHTTVEGPHFSLFAELPILCKYEFLSSKKIVSIDYNNQTRVISAINHDYKNLSDNPECIWFMEDNMNTQEVLTSESLPTKEFSKDSKQYKKLKEMFHFNNIFKENIDGKSQLVVHNKFPDRIIKDGDFHYKHTFGAIISLDTYEFCSESYNKLILEGSENEIKFYQSNTQEIIKITDPTENL